MLLVVLSIVNRDSAVYYSIRLASGTLHLRNAVALVIIIVVEIANFEVIFYRVGLACSHFNDQYI